MNINTTALNNPIPINYQHTPLPILINETTISYHNFGKKSFYKLTAGILENRYTDLNLKNLELIGKTKTGQKEFIGQVGDNESKLISIWLDRCKGISL